jgi:hypothetical protein
MTIRLLLAAALLAAANAFAQSWPLKPVRIIVTFAPGGSSDIVARVLAEELGPRRGGRVVVEKVDTERLEAIAAEHELTVVAAGRADLCLLEPLD